jgi:GntR family transcriptional regulator
VRELRYQTIAGDLRRRVTAGEFAAGRLLPSESELSEAYGASRVTIRKALDALRGEGLVDARQGFGWFVAGEPVRQLLGRLGTIEDQLAASGIVPERRVLDFAFVAASRRAQLVLGVDNVLRVRRLNLADGHPFARVTVWVPESLAHHLSRADVEGASFYELLSRPLGDRPALRIAGATQTIGAAAASPADATLLEIPAGSPVLRCERITRTTDGAPILLAEHVFAAAHTQFVVDLPLADGSIAPSGLRLVE